MKNYQKIIVTAALAAAVIFGFGRTASAMHIMEGYLPPLFCIAWGVLSLPFFSRRIFFHQKDGQQRPAADDDTCYVRSIHLRYLFFKNPLCHRKLFPHDRYRTWRHSVRTSGCKHTGHHRSDLPAVLLAHGGLTTLGANTFSMAVAGPFLSFAVYKICQKCG